MPRKIVMSEEIKAIEKNVRRHIIQEVRQTYVGWRPATLNPAWTNALKRLEATGKIVFRGDLGGYVPKEWIKRLESTNQSVLSYVRYRQAQTGQGTDGEKWTRTRKAALVRLHMAGLLEKASDGQFVVATSATAN